MNVKRVVVVVCGTGLVGAWLFAAVRTQPSASGTAVENAEQGSPTVDPLVADLQAETARLRERLRSAPTPRQPGRNPFLFAQASPPMRPQGREPAAAPADAAPHVELAPDLRLVGIAEEAVPDGSIRRTAIITGMGELFLSGVDELIAGRFRVEAIGADAVRLVDVADRRILILALP